MPEGLCQLPLLNLSSHLPGGLCQLPLLDLSSHLPEGLYLLPLLSWHVPLCHGLPRLLTQHSQRRVLGGQRRAGRGLLPECLLGWAVRNAETAAAALTPEAVGSVLRMMSHRALPYVWMEG